MGISFTSKDQELTFKPKPIPQVAFWNWCKFRNHPTPARSNTMRRLELQKAIGWPSTSRLIIQDGRFIHPTKGPKVNSPGKFIGVKKEHLLPKPTPKVRNPLNITIQSMTGWQRAQYARAMRVIRQEEKRLTPDIQLSLAEAWLTTPRRA